MMIDPIPLCVCGTVEIPLAEFVALAGNAPDPAAFLHDDEQRLAYLQRRLADAIDSPLTSPGSQVVARQVLEYFDVDLLPHFATKTLETLRDGNCHDRLLTSARSPRLGLLFVAWNGTHREVQPQRVGEYLGQIVSAGRVLAERGIRLTGLLEIDAYVRDNADAKRPTLPLDAVFEVDFEYSYVPGFLLGNPDERGPLQPLLRLNPDLCTAEERQLLQRFIDR